jgi:hypothetical protein
LIKSKLTKDSRNLANDFAVLRGGTIEWHAVLPWTSLRLTCTLATKGKASRIDEKCSKSVIRHFNFGVRYVAGICGLIS